MSGRSNGATPWLVLWVGALLAVLTVALIAVHGRAPVSAPEVRLDIALPKAPPIPDSPRLPWAPTPTPK